MSAIFIDVSACVSEITGERLFRFIDHLGENFLLSKVRRFRMVHSQDVQASSRVVRAPVYEAGDAQVRHPCGANEFPPVDPGVRNGYLTP